MNSHFVASPSQPATFPERFHTLWYMFIRAAENIDGDSAEQDRLFNQLVYAKELGTPVTQQEIPSVPVSPWRGLPYLVDDFQVAWVEKSWQLRPHERRNFAAFTARLLALGSCDLDISLCALWLLRETLEASRPIEPDPTTPPRTPLSELLPAVAQWFQISNTKLLKLAVHQWGDGNNTELALPGELARAEAVDRPGFSILRWVFWRKRLGELCYHQGASDVAATAKIAFEHMIITGRLLGHQIPGEKSYWSRVYHTLDMELKRSGKPSVGLEEIVTEPAWADEDELQQAS